MKNIKKRAASVIVAAATILTVGAASFSGTLPGFIPNLSISASAATGVSYINASGSAKVCSSYTKIKSSTTKLTGGWYVVSGKVTIDGRLNVTDDSYIILADGSNLTVKGGISVASGVKFNVYTDVGSEASLYAGTTNGANTTAASGACGIGGSGAKVNIVGGNVYAKGGSGSYGIQGSDIHLYWTNPTDSIYASSYSTKVQVIDAFADKANGKAYNYQNVSATAIGGTTLKAAFVVDKDTVSMADGAYVVMDSVKSSGRIEVIGDVELYLANGGTLTADEGISVPNGSSLNIYGGGKLYAGTRNGSTFLINGENAGIGSSNGGEAGEIVINSGTVYSNGGRYSAGIGGSRADILIVGGTVTANGGHYGAGIGSGYSDKGSTVEILGGNVTATGGTSAAGIGSGYYSTASTVSLSYTKETDSIYASSYSGNINLLKTMYTESGTAANKNNMGGTKLTPTINAYTVTFETNGAGYVAPKYVAPGKQLAMMPYVERAGYTFEGWYTDPNFRYKFNDNSAINANMTLYAKWTYGVHKVTFNSNGGPALDPVYVNHGSTLNSQPLPYRNGFNFVGWYYDTRLTQPFYYYNTVINSDLTLYAKWEVAVTNYTVTFNTSGGTFMGSMTVAPNSYINDPGIPSKEGYVFNGWYTDAACTRYFDFTTTRINSNMTLYAGWKSLVNTYTVRFFLDGRSVDYQTIEEGGFARDPFNGAYEWKTASGQSFSFNTAIRMDYDLNATTPVLREYTVNFYLDGSLVKTEKITEGGYAYDPYNGMYQWTTGSGQSFSFNTAIRMDYDLNATAGPIFKRGVWAAYDNSSNVLSCYFVFYDETSGFMRTWEGKDVPFTCVQNGSTINFDLGGSMSNTYAEFDRSSMIGTVYYNNVDIITYRFEYVPYADPNTFSNSSYTGSTFGTAGIVGIVAGGVVLLGGGAAAGYALGRKKKKEQ